MSVAGRRVGLLEGNRSDLWHHITAVIQALDPCLVVIENVRGLLTSPAAASGEVESCPWCLGNGAGQPAVRALGAVLGSLADLGRDACWCVLRASDIGAPHRRERLFLAAWRRDAPAEDADQQPRVQRRQPAPPSKRKQGGHGPSLADEVEWLLPTPKASDGAKGSPRQRHGNGDLTLPSAAAQMHQHAAAQSATSEQTAAPLFDAAALNRNTRSAGADTPRPSPDGRGSPARHRRRPMTRAVSHHGSWSGCKAWTTAG